MKLLSSISTAILLSASAAYASELTPPQELPSGVYETDPGHTSLVWKVNHLGLSNYTARFTDVKASLTYDPKDPANSKVVAVIDPLSVKTDFPNPEKVDFDKKLSSGKEWFNAAEFPKITFESTKITKTGDTSADITGNLTFLGVVKPVTLKASFNGAYAKKPYAEVPALGFSASTSLKRSDWGFSTYVPVIGDEVQVAIETEFHKTK